MTLQVTSDAVEGGQDGVITLARNTTGDSLTVYYSIDQADSSGVLGTDYSGPGATGSVTFGPEESTVTLSISAIDDGVAEGNETLVLCLQTDSAYNVGSPSVATVVICDSGSGVPLPYGTTGFYTCAETWSGSMVYDASGTSTYSYSANGVNASGSGSYTEHDTLAYQGHNTLTESYYIPCTAEAVIDATSAGGLALPDSATSTVQTDYADIVDTTSDYQSQGSSTYSDPVESYSSAFNSHTSGTTHDEWQQTGVVGAGGSTFTTSEAHSGTLSASYSGTWTDTWNNTTSTSGNWSTSWSTSSSYTWSTGTPPTTPLQPPTYNGPSPAAIDALVNSLAAHSAAASAQPTLLPAAVDAAILSSQSLDSAPDGSGGGAIYQILCEDGTGGGSGGSGGTGGGGSGESSGTIISGWWDDMGGWTPVPTSDNYQDWFSSPEYGQWYAQFMASQLAAGAPTAALLVVPLFEYAPSAPLTQLPGAGPLRSPKLQRPAVQTLDNPKFSAWSWFWNGAGKPPSIIQKEYGAIKPHILPKRDPDTSEGVGGGQTKVVTGIPYGFLVGSQAAGPCIIAIISKPSPKKPGDLVLKYDVVVSHFYPGDDPSSVWSQIGSLPPGTRVAIAGGNGERASNTQLLVTIASLAHRKGVTIVGYFRGSGLFVDNLGTYYVFESDLK